MMDEISAYSVIALILLIISASFIVVRGLG
jgi:hypothetical protein